jgi:hypothetical protein
LLYDSPDRDRLIHTIDENLDTSLDQQRFRDSMHKSYPLNEASHGIGLAYDAVKNRVIRGDRAASEGLAASQQWAKRLSDDPQHGVFIHGIGGGHHWR